MIKFLTLLLGMALLLAGCVVPDAWVVNAPPTGTNPGTNPGATPHSNPMSLHEHLESALAHAPANSETFAFTDWSLLKQIAGFDDLTSQDSMDDRLEFILPLSVREQALGSFYANSHFLNHAEDWGWDATDLLWETNLTSTGPPVYVLRFRDDFDFAPVFARLAERGYSVLDHQGVPLYSHPLELSAEWLRTSDFAILNIGYLEEAKVFVLAAAPETVTATLDSLAAGSTLDTLPGVRSVAAELGAAAAVILSPLGCQPLDVAMMLRGNSTEIETLRAELRQSGISGLYTTFGLGYRVETINGEAVPLGVFVHHYPIASQARADLEPRRLLAQSGHSLTRDVAYSELFDVFEAKVVSTGTGAANLVLTLRARERPPQFFFQMFYSRDLTFSACGF